MTAAEVAARNWPPGTRFQQPSCKTFWSAVRRTPCRVSVTRDRWNPVTHRYQNVGRHLIPSAELTVILPTGGRL